jgi:uncharacterized protein (TIGR02996 family)
MSNAIKLTIGVTAARVLFPTLPDSTAPGHSEGKRKLDEFHELFMARWDLYGGADGSCCRARILLPRDLGAAVRFLYRIELIRSVVALKKASTWVVGNRAMISRSLNTLVPRIVRKMGLPCSPYEGLVKGVERTALPPMERAFVDSIVRDPEDVATWMGYADWLSDQDGEASARGQLIAMNLYRRAH